MNIFYIKSRKTVTYGKGIAMHMVMIFLIMLSCKTRKDEAKMPRPNILFAISDDQSYPHTSSYGTEWVSTPAFDRVARMGVLFNNAFVAAPQCSPNRAAILTGKNIGQLEEAGTHASFFPKKFTVFTDLLEEAGYEIGFTGKAWGPGDWEASGWPRNPVGPEYNSLALDEVPAEGINHRDYFGNFIDFYQQKEADKPFFFWYGAHEPHRVYQAGTGLNAGKQLEGVTPPGFLPDDSVIRADLLDYAFEIEWFDYHLERMMDFLQDKGVLENTLIVVTSDNGMPFPGAKANLTEYGTHVPFAVSWPAGIKGGAISEALISHVDLAPTFLALGGVTELPEMTGLSFAPVLLGESDATRDFVITGRERHTHARPDNLGYPARAIRTQDYLYIWNMKPDRWPVGDPVDPAEELVRMQSMPEEQYRSLLPGYHDIDGSPSKTFVMDLRDDEGVRPSFVADFEKRPGEQMFNIREDPACINNLADEPQLQEVKNHLKASLESELKKQADPRVLGTGDIFDSYPRISSMRQFDGFKERGKYNPAYQIKENEQ